MRLSSGRIFLAYLLRAYFFIQLFLLSVSLCLHLAPLLTLQEEAEDGKPHGRPHADHGDDDDDDDYCVHWKQSQRKLGRGSFPPEQKVRRESELPS